MSGTRAGFYLHNPTVSLVILQAAICKFFFLRGLDKITFILVLHQSWLKFASHWVIHFYFLLLLTLLSILFSVPPFSIQAFQLTLWRFLLRLSSYINIGTPHSSVSISFSLFTVRNPVYFYGFTYYLYPMTNKFLSPALIFLLAQLFNCLYIHLDVLEIPRLNMTKREHIISLHHTHILLVGVIGFGVLYF